MLEASERSLVALVAAAGYGKTSLLTQLRRELLATGGAVAWISSEPEDDAVIFIPALVESVQDAIGMPVTTMSLDRVSGVAPDLWLASELLVRIHELATPTWLLIDDLHHLADADVTEFVHYLVCNAPENFHVVVSGRTEPGFGVLDLQVQNQFALFDTDDLRFDLAETATFLQGCFGADIDIDACARLHERTDGWPMALQLAVAAIGRKGDPSRNLLNLSGTTGDIARYFAHFLHERTTPEIAAMLIRSSVLGDLRPPLCAAIADLDDCVEMLSGLEQETGLVSSIEGGDELYRLHPLFSEYLRSLAARLPPEEVANLHRIAAHWYAGQGMHEEAAEHAFCAGMRAQAMEWIALALRQLGALGRVVEVLSWLDRLPAEELERREGIQLTAAWACALCYRPLDAERLAQVILHRPGVTAEAALQANIVRSAVAIHGDDYERAIRCIESHGEPRDPLHCNSMSFVAIHSGFPEKARYYHRLARQQGLGSSYYGSMYGAFAEGLSYLVQGQAGAARRVYAQALATAESRTGRRAPVAALQAAGLAAACWELGAGQEARSLLAGRLDLIEQNALPDGVLLAHLVIARHESEMNREDRALDALNSLAAIGRARSQPRLVVASLAAQLHQHAVQNRLESCRLLLGSIDEIVDEPADPEGALARNLQIPREIAAARVALLEFDLERACMALDRASAFAARGGRGRDAITIGILRACCTDGRRDEGLLQLAETLSIAESFGLVRVIADDWPAAAELLLTLKDSEYPPRFGISHEFMAQVLHCCRSTSSVEEGRGSGISEGRTLHARTTAREFEILSALARGLSNKEIANMLDIGPNTVKWHLKNLFVKLDAANRRHAVNRARLLGIID